MQPRRSLPSPIADPLWDNSPLAVDLTYVQIGSRGASTRSHFTALGA